MSTEIIGEIVRIELGDATESESMAKLLAEKMRAAYPSAWGVRSEGAAVVADIRWGDMVACLRAYARGFVDALEATAA